MRLPRDAACAADLGIAWWITLMAYDDAAGIRCEEGCGIIPCITGSPMHGNKNLVFAEAGSSGPVSQCRCFDNSRAGTFTD